MSIDRVLIADDEPLCREFLAETLIRRGCDVAMASTGAEALSTFTAEDFDLVMSDLRMPEMDGLALLHRIKAISPEVPVVLITAYGSVETAVSAMRNDAEDFLQKPFTPETLEAMLNRLEERRRLERENHWLRSQLYRGRETTLVAESAAMKDVVRRARQFATTQATVLITGESGTGKELLAHLVHTESPRRDGPFIRVNCAGLTGARLESELFGHERGAFPGAVRKHEGRFELADRGTLLLDEVADVPLELQKRLLRVIEQQELERTGGTRTLRVDVRIIATASRSLKDEVRAGRFREDLFYRLNVMPIHIPPLRKRAADIRALAQAFAARFASENELPEPRFAAGTVDLLLAHAWPGNIRELENLMLRSIVIAGGRAIEPEHVRPDIVPLESTAPEISECVGRTLEAVERDLIIRTLEHTRFNRTEAGKLLGLTPRTLFNKIRLYESQGHLPATRSSSPSSCSTPSRGGAGRTTRAGRRGADGTTEPTPETVS